MASYFASGYVQQSDLQMSQKLLYSIIASAKGVSSFDVVFKNSFFAGYRRPFSDRLEIQFARKKENESMLYYWSVDNRGNPVNLSTQGIQNFNPLTRSYWTKTLATNSTNWSDSFLGIVNICCVKHFRRISYCSLGNDCKSFYQSNNRANRGTLKFRLQCCSSSRGSFTRRYWHLWQGIHYGAFWYANLYK